MPGPVLEPVPVRPFFKFLAWIIVVLGAITVAIGLIALCITAMPLPDRLFGLLLTAVLAHFFYAFGRAALSTADDETLPLVIPGSRTHRGLIVLLMLAGAGERYWAWYSGKEGIFALVLAAGLILFAVIAIVTLMRR